MAAKLLCPSCETSLKVPKILPRQVKCPRCGTRFDPTEEASASGEGGSGSGASAAVMLGVCGGGAFVLVLLVACIVLLSLPRSKPTEVADKNNPNGPRFGQTTDPYADHGGNKPADGGNNPAPPPPPPAPPPQGTPANAGTRWKAPLSAEQQEKVNLALDRGVEYVKKQIHEPSPGSYGTRLGAVALGGLTLLACGVPADDPAVQKALARVREEAEANPYTYDIALTVLFLDRLDDKADSPLIQKLALRLVAGQMQAGSWSYTCPRMSSGDQSELLSLLERLSPPLEQTNAVAGDDKGKGPVVIDRSKEPPLKTTPGKKPTKLPTGNEPRLPEAPRYNFKELAITKWEPGKRIDPKSPGGDNSNTQFALLAVWAAQKHGVPVDRSLALVDAHFRESQDNDGAWGYKPNSRQFADSMTCAGLLGLAVGRGLIRTEDAKKAAAGDPAVEKAMASLGKGIERMTAGPVRFTPGRSRPIGANAAGDLYYLWSLERVGVIYERQELGGKDWYGWGAQALVETQLADGSWSDSYRGLVDTCFALLFLKRANVATDLTDQLKTINMLDRVAEPRMP